MLKSTCCFNFNRLPVLLMVPKYSRYAAVLPFNIMFYQERFSHKEASIDIELGVLQ